MIQIYMDNTNVCILVWQKVKIHTFLSLSHIFPFISSPEDHTFFFDPKKLDQVKFLPFDQNILVKTLVHAERKKITDLPRREFEIFTEKRIVM